MTAWVGSDPWVGLEPWPGHVPVVVLTPTCELAGEGGTVVAGAVAALMVRGSVAAGGIAGDVEC